LQPEVREWVVPVCLGNFLDHVEVLVALGSAGLIDVGQEGDHADRGAFAVFVVDLLVVELEQVWLNVRLI